MIILNSKLNYSWNWWTSSFMLILCSIPTSRHLLDLTCRMQPLQVHDSVTHLGPELHFSDDQPYQRPFYMLFSIYGSLLKKCLFRCFTNFSVCWSIPFLKFDDHFVIVLRKFIRLFIQNMDWDYFFPWSELLFHFPTITQ